MRLARMMLGVALGATLAVGTVGCKTVYEPVRVHERIGDTRIDPLAMQLPEAGRPGTPLERDVVVMQPRTVVDWDGIGRGTCRVFEGIGIGLWYATLITLRVLAECATCCCR